MFHYDGGLRITSIDLAVDVRRRQPRGFISHAHTDHMARHELAYCTPTTAALYQHRYGTRPTRPMPFGQPLVWGELTLTTHPAGHVFGSAMLSLSGPDGTLLYTGDFKLRPSATAEAAAPPSPTCSLWRVPMAIRAIGCRRVTRRLPSFSSSCSRSSMPAAHR